MPKKCLVCKAEPSLMCKRSFHMFPKNESMKQKWLDAINVSKTPNFKTAYICSDHFDAGSFFYSDELRRRRRLCKEAVPKQKSQNSPNDPRQSETQETAMIGISNCEVSDVRDGKSLEANTNETVMYTDEVPFTNSLEFQKSNVLEDVSLQSHLNEDIVMCTDEVSFIKSIDSQESGVSKDLHLKSSTEKITETDTQEKPFNNSDMLNGTSSSQSNSKKRKRSFDDIRTAKRVRFMNGFKTEYVCREDFVSIEAWHKFLRYSAYQRSRTAAAQNKNSRKQNKIKNLTNLISTLEKRDEFDAAEYLKDLPSHIKELLARMKERKSTSPFPANLKTFARTLHFHSPAAYEVVRRSFLKSLPCVQTLNSWICAKDYKPGISEKTIDHVSEIVKRESEKGKKLVFNITFDEMSIKQHREWDKNTHSWKGLVDLGGQLNELNPNGEQKIATKSLVFMLVNINGGFKVPVAHYLIHSLTGVEKAILLKDLLVKLNEKKIDVVSVTFDGDRAHRTACESLGANLNYKDKDNFKPYFEHPGTSKPVYIFYDPCHCLKLIRNYFATKGPIIYDGQEYIHWGFIQKLQKAQESARLHFACKISNRHVNFYKEKMKVFLAAQVLSRSVSVALNLLESSYKDQDIENASSTAKFCKNFNDIFDLLNVRSKFSKSPTQMSINKSNLKEIEKKIDEYIDYIEKLEINEKVKKRKTKSGREVFENSMNPNQVDIENPEISIDINGAVDPEIEMNSMNTDSEVTVRKSVLQSDSVSTGFLGFIICLKNLYSLANYLIQNNIVEYFLSYKLSQDHIEMFFSAIRSMNGFNNNPTTTQYNSAYKKLLLNRLDITTSSSANCTPLDQTLLLSEDISITDEQSNNNNNNKLSNSSSKEVSPGKKERVALSNITNEKCNDNNNNLSKTSCKGLSPTKRERVALSNITNAHSAYNNDQCSNIHTQVNSIKKKRVRKSKLQPINVGDFLKNDNYHMFEHNYSSIAVNEGWCFSEESEDIVKHTAGAVARILSNKVHCDKCRDLLLDTTNSTIKSKLTEAKDYGGLKYASYDVNFICKCTEKIIRGQKYLIQKNVNAQVITETLKILPTSILDDEHFLEQELSMDHDRHQLILLTIQTYIDIRLKYEGKILQDQSQRVRMQNNKLTIFKGQ